MFLQKITLLKWHPLLVPIQKLHADLNKNEITINQPKMEDLFLKNYTRFVIFSSLRLNCPKLMWGQEKGRILTVSPSLAIGEGDQELEDLQIGHQRRRSGIGRFLVRALEREIRNQKLSNQVVVPGFNMREWKWKEVGVYTKATSPTLVYKTCGGFSSN